MIPSVLVYLTKSPKHYKDVFIKSAYSGFKEADIQLYVVKVYLSYIFLETVINADKTYKPSEFTSLRVLKYFSITPNKVSTTCYSIYVANVVPRIAPCIILNKPD